MYLSPPTLLVQQAVSHSPDHQFLLGLDPQLVLDAVDGVSDRHRLVAPKLSDLSVRQPLCKQREDLTLPHSQPAQLVLCVAPQCADSGEHAPYHVAGNPVLAIRHVTDGVQQLAIIDLMIPFDSSEIVRWADNPDADHQLPELVRRLILATVPMPSLLHMPSGSSVSRPGWDGLLVVEKGNAWVPDGASAWEFSREGDPKRKATDDYNKRTTDSKGVDTPISKFVFVTPRKWDGKLAWVNERQEEGPWANVRVLDADDLVAWLGQAPAVAHWFARLIGKLPATGVVPLDEWWENWSIVANPRISAELVTAGRQDQAERISQWFRAESSHYYVQGNTQDEAIAFLAGCAQADERQWGPALLARVVVVENADAWRSLEGHSSPLVLVRNFSGGNVSPQIAVGRGHHVLTPLGEHEEPSGAGVTLPRLGREETLQELANMGLSEVKARTLVRSTARRLSIMRRRLVDEAGGPTPDWASKVDPIIKTARGLN